MAALAGVLAPISQADINETYLATPRLEIDDTKTLVSAQLLSKTTDGEKVVYTVFFATNSNEPILERELERWLCENKRLRGRLGRSKVACRVRFYVRSNYQGKGFAHYIMIREEDLFQRWGAQEIHVTAMDAGRWVWTRAKFGYKIPAVDFFLLQQRYVEWQREKGAVKIVRAEILSDFPKEFLLSAPSSIDLYKDL